LAEPLSVAVRAFRRARPRFSDVAVVVGSGTIGLFVLQLLRLSGVRALVVEPQPGRQDLARLGAADVVGSWADDGGGIHGAPPTFDCSGVAEEMAAAVSASAPGWSLVLVGAPRGDCPVWGDIIRNELTVIASMSHGAS